MAFAQFRDGGTVFQVRVGVVARASGRVLLHRTVGDDIWSLPGGRLMVGETAAQAAVREMQEEIGADIEAGDILWIIENFFHTNALDHIGLGGEPIDHHEIGLYVEAKLPHHLEESDSFMGAELAGTDAEFGLEFRWFDPGQLREIDVRPAVLIDLLAGDQRDTGTQILSRVVGSSPPADA
jgi:8-oxo-dGTP pyrophosphatase MutT (NUDIX family)